MMKRTLAFVVVALSLAAAVPARVQALPWVTVTGRSISLSISLPGGIGSDVSLSFEDVTGLNLLNLGLSAQLVNPTSPTFLARLPAGVTPALPLLLRIEPPYFGGLSFRGIMSLELHTHNLLYLPNTPLRLFRAPLGGPFEDMTAEMGPGSYRARGTSGGFSEFLIVADTRTVDQAINSKFDSLEDLLTEYGGQMPAALENDLATRLATARADFASGAVADAIQGIDDFRTVVEQHSGTDIPQVWRAARDLDNVAGYLRAGAMTLRFSLARKLP
jgi:hypothetical protein